MEYEQLEKQAKVDFNEKSKISPIKFNTSDFDVHLCSSIYNKTCQKLDISMKAQCSCLMIFDLLLDPAVGIRLSLLTGEIILSP